MAASTRSFVASLENLAILICGNPRNSGTGANFAACAKFVACTRITLPAPARAIRRPARISPPLRNSWPVPELPSPHQPAQFGDRREFRRLCEIRGLYPNYPPRTSPRNSGTGANFAACAKFVACTRITLPAPARAIRGLAPISPPVRNSWPVPELPPALTRVIRRPARISPFSSGRVSSTSWRTVPEIRAL